MTTLQRVQAWARYPVSMDVTTAILRSDGVPDEEIRAAYDAVAADPQYVTEIDRSIATIVYAP